MNIFTWIQDKTRTVTSTATELAQVVRELATKANEKITPFAAGVYNRLVPVATSIKDAAIEGYKATKSFKSGAISTSNSVYSGVSAVSSIAKSAAYLLKTTGYNTPRLIADAYYYQDDAATLTAKNIAVEDLAKLSESIVNAYTQVTECLSAAYEGTKNNCTGVEHLAKATYSALDASAKTGYMIGEGAVALGQGVYNSLFAYDFSKKNVANLDQSIELLEIQKTLDRDDSVPANLSNSISG